MPVRRIQTRAISFDRGLLSGDSDYGTKPNCMRRVDNVLFRPLRAMSVRQGSRDLSGGQLSQQPTSLAKYYNPSGNRLMVATKSGAAGNIYRVTPSSYVAQTLPFAPTDLRWTFTNLNGILIGQQWGSAQSPIFCAGTDTWLSCNLPTSGQPTVANVAGAGPETGNRYYRVRERYNNGSSLAGIASTVINTGGANFVRLTFPATSGRADRVGWTVERTKAGATNAGPWWFVADVAGSPATYDDSRLDTDLFTLIDDGMHGSALYPAAGTCPRFEGVIAYADRLFGWTGSILYASQMIGDEESTGIFNFDPELQYFFDKDDGDTIRCVKTQGDRLVVWKGRSIWALEGTHPDNFTVTKIYDGLGSAGPRAVASFGTWCVFHSGKSGLHLLAGNEIKAIGWLEAGYYIDQVDETRSDEVLLVNYLGEMCLCWVPTKNNTYVDDTIVFDLRSKTWSHLKGWRAVDAFVQKDEADFNRAGLIFADPKQITPSSVSSFSTNASYVAWMDNRVAQAQTYVQKYDYLGVPQWTANGVQCGNASSSITISDDSYRPTAVFNDDLAGGCIVVWAEARASGQYSLFAQKFNNSGAPLWAANGVNVRNGAALAGFTRHHSAFTDGAGGVIITWVDTRSGTGKVYGQRLTSAAGAPQWGANGLAIDMGGAGYEDFSTGVSDGAGGAYISCQLTNISTYAVKLKRVDSTGAATAGFVTPLTMNTASSFITAPARMVSAGADGVLLAWTESVSSLVYVNRVSDAGVRAWGSGGVAVNDIPASNVTGLSLCGDSAGGAFVAWRYGITGPTTAGIAVQRVTDNGVKEFAPAVKVRELVSPEICDLLAGRDLMAPDGAGGCMVFWREESLAMAGGYDACAQKLSASGVMQWAQPAVLAYGTALDDENPSRVCTDGGGGVLAVVLSGAGATQNLRLLRLGPLGTPTWASPTPISGAAGYRYGASLCYTTAAGPDLPPSLIPYWHLWVGFQGTKDERDINGQNGIPIRAEWETPLLDDGAPDVLKDYERLELFVDTSAASMSATMSFEANESGPISLVLTGQSSQSIWNQFYWNDGVTRWGGSQGRQSYVAGLPEGTLGRRYKLKFSSDLDSPMTAGGYVVDAAILPTRDF